MKNSTINAHKFALTSLFSAVVLTGCQTIEQNSNINTATQIPAQATTTPTVLIIPKVVRKLEPSDDAEVIIMGPVDYDNQKIKDSESHKFLELPVDSLNRYNWQLAEWIDNQNLVTEIVSEQAVVLDIRPNNLIFSYGGCERYQIIHSEIIEGKYSSHNVSNISPPSCSTDKKQSSLNRSLLAEQLQSASVESYLNDSFAPFSRSRFSYELLALKANNYQLALKLNSKTLMFTGTMKPLQPTQGLPISYEFLKDYKWRLVSALNSENQPIIELNRPGFPVITYFGYSMYNDEHHVGFSSDCNGVGGPYILTPDNQLLIGSGNQTMMGCGPKREAAEDKIKQLEQLSSSQLSLEQLENTNIDNTELPYYLLTQKLETGETLIWKNSATVSR